MKRRSSAYLLGLVGALSACSPQEQAGHTATHSQERVIREVVVEENQRNLDFWRSKYGLGKAALGEITVASTDDDVAIMCDLMTPSAYDDVFFCPQDRKIVVRPSALIGIAESIGIDPDNTPALKALARTAVAHEGAHWVQSIVDPTMTFAGGTIYAERQADCLAGYRMAGFPYTQKEVTDTLSVLQQLGAAENPNTEQQTHGNSEQRPDDFRKGFNAARALFATRTTPPHTGIPDACAVL